MAISSKSWFSFKLNGKPRDKIPSHLPKSFKPCHSTLISIDATRHKSHHRESGSYFLFSTECTVTVSTNHLYEVLRCIPKVHVTFVSKLYAGRTSDKKLTQECGVPNQFVPRDSIKADNGFTLQIYYQMELSYISRNFKLIISLILKK